MRLWKSIAIILALFLVCSCTVVTDKTVITPQVVPSVDGDYEISKEITKKPPRTVAILPMVNRTNSDQAFEVVRRTLYNHFSSLRYVDLELYQVDARLRQANLLDAETVAKSSPEEMGRILMVDAVIYGEITDYDRVYVGLYSQVSVGAQLQMMDTKTGKLLWKGKHTSRKHSGGISASPVGLILTAITTAVNVREIELFRTSDDLFRTMVQAIPSPTLGEAQRPPKIIILVQDAVGKPKKIGDVIRVAMEGDPRMQASFDIGDFKKSIPMREESSGSYVGEHKILPGENVEEALISGRLTDDAGNSSTWIDVLGTVTIDTVPPEPPQVLAAIGRDQRALLSWQSNQEKDLAGYRVYRSDTPLTGYLSIAETELTELADQNVENGRPYYFHVTALDLAGNESKPSTKVIALPVAPGPTQVQGEISVDTTWLAGASPYVLVGEVEVADKTTLSIESGTEVVSSGPGLTVRGRLKAVGEKGRTIVFRGSEESQWQGLRLFGSGESELQFCRISDAQVGLVIRSASPQIRFCELADNEIGIRIEESFAKPIISENTFRDNRQAALEVLATAAPRVENNLITGNHGLGVRLKTAGGSLSGNRITNNEAGGILASGSTTVISQNNVHVNQSFDLRNQGDGAPLTASSNWWGTIQVLPLLARVQGRVKFATVLDSAYPDGKEITLNILQGTLKGKIEDDAYLILANSPYVVSASVIIDGGATLTIQPGVELRFNPGKTALVVRDGGIKAQGNLETPIVFTSNSSSGSPGFYESAVRFENKTRVPSFFEYCVFRHAKNALVINYGSPDIAYTLIAQNSQSGIQCRNNASPKIFFNTLRDNSGTGAIECYGRSAPKINHNNIYRNPFAIQSFSTLYVDARENWWGSSPPDPDLFIGQVNSAGALKSPVPGAFDPEYSKKDNDT
jgi:parallel beta-helix repeat protein